MLPTNDCDHGDVHIKGWKDQTATRIGEKFIFKLFGSEKKWKSYWKYLIGCSIDN